MLLTICLTKEDIVTQRMGCHFEIITPNGLNINFTPEAVNELISDFTQLLRDVPITLSTKTTNSPNMQLGKEVQEKITGFRGILTGVASYITGCDQYYVQPPLKDGSFVEGRWFDEGRLEVIGEGIAAESVQAAENGCDTPPPPGK